MAQARLQELVVQLPPVNLANFDTFKSSGVNLHLVNVYGPQSPTEKISFLNDLQMLCMNSPLSLVLLGDFNLIAAAADKSNGNINRGLVNAFRGFINALELKDMYLHGRRYTWCNEKLNVVLVHL